MKLKQDFCNMMTELLGKDEAQQLFEVLDGTAPTSIRLSRHKAPSDLTFDLGTPVPWSQRGYYLSTRPTFTGQSAFHAGAFYVQEASSMLLDAIHPLLQQGPLVALDLCAAPGGKSTLLLDMLPQDSLLVANEVVRHRANILCENLQKWGNPNCIVTNTMPQQLGKLEETFDIILVDAPCSGEGMFRKEPASRNEWNAQSPQMCAARQQDILADIWGALKPEGLLIYSTCTMNTLENEAIVSYLVEELGGSAVTLGELSNGVWLSPFTDYPCYRMMPHRVEGEGLFMAVVRKDVSTQNQKHRNRPQDKSKELDKRKIPQEVYSYLVPDTSFVWELRGEELSAFPSHIIPTLRALQSLKIPILTAGVPIGTIKGKSLIPHTALALSTVLDPNAFERIELEDHQVIPYLSREVIQIDATISTGIKIVQHKGLALGFVKHLGNRCNNLYPQEWRIRHSEKLQQH